MAVTTEPYPVLSHHFDNLEQQRGSARLGMWLFLMTEVLFFGGLFAAFTAYRMWYADGFAAGSSRLIIGIAGVNTLLLLTSSLTMTFAIHNAQKGQRSALLLNLALTAFLGVAFLALKAVEYRIDFAEHLVPGRAISNNADEILKTEAFTKSAEFARLSHDDQEHYKHELDRLSPAQRELYARVNAPVYDPSVTQGSTGGPSAQPQEQELGTVTGKERQRLPHVQLFFLFYYSMTGLHVVHLTVGVGVVVWLFVWAYIGKIPKERYPLVEISSLYWHFVDLLWLFLLGLLYLSGPHNSLFS